MSFFRSLSRAGASLWAGEGRGLLYLGAGTAVAFVFGPLLQLLAARQLDERDYATFVLALGIASIAGMLAAVVQPIAATAAAEDQPAEGRHDWWPWAGAVALLGIAVAALAPSVGAFVAILALAQIPLHLAFAAGLGILQSRRRFAAIAASSAVFPVARLTFAVGWVAAGVVSVTAFVAALPVALAAALGGLGLAGAFRAIGIRALIARVPAEWFAAWFGVALLLNGDAIIGRLFLGEVDAGRYGVALTIGRLVPFAAWPIATVLLPVAAAAEPGRGRERILATLAVCAVLGSGLFAVAGIAPGPAVQLITGEGDTGPYATLVRLHIVAGTIAALATLTCTQLFARTQTLPWRWAIACFVPVVAASAVSESPVVTVVSQALALALFWLVAVRRSVQGENA
jgi:O-antigen/teichoic acid export membrane protein